jgi:cytochrome b
MLGGDDSRQGEGSRGTEARHVVIVWDSPTRIFHWLAAVLVAAAYATWRLNWMEWHGRIGSVLLALVFFRLLWGFFGSLTARFSGFLASPRMALRHLAQILRREPDRQVGHNPAGGWMVLLLLALLLGETLTGVYIDNDIVNEGPLTEFIPARIANAIDALHGIFWNTLLAAVLLHIAAILLYATVKGHNLLLPMITGRKTLSAGVPQPRMAGLARAAFLLACSGIAAAALVKYL